MAASVVRDDMPWLYGLAMEVYRAVKAENVEAIEREMKRLRRFSEVMMRGPFMEEFGFGSRESHMFAMEFPRMLEHCSSTWPRATVWNTFLDAFPSVRREQAIAPLGLAAKLVTDGARSFRGEAEQLTW